MILDRDLQKIMLEKMSTRYPRYYNFNDDFDSNSSDYYHAVKNLFYLQEHGLVKENSVFMSKAIGGDGHIQFGNATITNKGLDFLANDGGLSAILNTVTVKFEAETLKAILENRINQSDLDPEHKQSMIDSLRELPAESIKHLTTELLTRGLDNLPAAILLIGTYLGVS